MQGIRHTGIYVHDIEKMVAFYCNDLGMRVAVHEIEKGLYIDTVLGLFDAEIELYKLKAEDDSVIELLKYSSSSAEEKRPIWQTGQIHIAITVENVYAMYHQLSESGIRFISPPQESPNGYARVCFCQDPEGNYLELVEVLAHE